MGPGCKIQNRTRLVLREQFRNERGISNIAVDEDVPTVIFDTREVLQVFCVG